MNFPVFNISKFYVANTTRLGLRFSLNFDGCPSNTSGNPLHKYLRKLKKKVTRIGTDWHGSVINTESVPIRANPRHVCTETMTPTYSVLPLPDALTTLTASVLNYSTHHHGSVLTARNQHPPSNFPHISSKN